MSGRFQNTGRGSSGRSTGRGSYRQGRGNGQYNRKQNGNGAQKEKKFHPLTSGNIPHCSIQDLVLIANNGFTSDYLAALQQLEAVCGFLPCVMSF